MLASGVVLQALLADLAVLEGDGGVERVGEGVEGGAGDLALQTEWVDHAADVDRADHALDVQLLPFITASMSWAT